MKADLGQHISLDDKGFAVNGSKLVALEKVKPLFLPPIPIVHEQWLIVIEQMIYVTPILAGIALGCSRLSVLLLYHRIFETRIFWLSVYFMSAINISWIVSFVFVFIFRCTPITQVWMAQQGERKHCIGIQSNYAYAVSSVILDFMVLSLPWPMIWKLRMQTRQKIAVMAIFMLGAMWVWFESTISKADKLLVLRRLG